ncbi:putative amidase AmiB2 [Mycolicibacterium anyangense]|uniref:amidase n=1 Tax=Mycolicibacterium anyangense TaxID=1431246 RepID=A0A6N4W547_9MYCO|nr:amidase [Mycolicibacterium anyangense]BBZ77070.1 putative amidase AmiB2 [Mycolicibacterium anyangense]
MDLTDIAFAGAAEQARMLAAGTITAPALLDLYLDRIARVDREVRAYRVVLTERARKEAAAAQQRLEAGERLPLLGVPIAIKDDVDVADEFTCYGSSAHGLPPTQDAEVVRRLREAGAVILGKTAVPEMMLWPFTETVAFGSTHNPWDLARAPGGSSGGSGAAVAAGLAPMALGSDGAGSIRIPSTWCGLFGIKPQRDRVPMDPHTDAWQGLSVNGPITRTVEDAALFLDVTNTARAPRGGFVAAAARKPKKLRIALSAKIPPTVVGHVGGAQQKALDGVEALLRDLGHEVIWRDPDYPAWAVYGHVLPRMWRGIYDDVQQLPHRERLEPRTKALARLGGLISDQQIARIRAAEATLAARVGSIFDDVDVLITPGTATGPSRVGQYQHRGGLATLAMVASRVPFHAIFNATGQPAAVVPWGLDGEGIPVSVQLVGRPSDEATLLSLSHQIEKARPWANRRPPVS